MNRTFTRNILRTVVAQLSQTIGWNSIQSTPLELMVDFLHRYLDDLCKVTHRYSEQFGQTQPNLDHLGLAFQDLGIDLQDLGEYVRNVESVPCVHDVPKFPIERETHLNFLKPGSNEVVHRPVHVHEHLPPMHPDLEDQDKKPPMSETAATNADGMINNSGVFKRPGDPLESPAMKRTRMMLEVEEGRPMREISSVIMTTSGFLSPAREGKLPEARAPIFPSDIGGRSPTPSSFPTVPPEIKSEKKKKSVSKKSGGLGSKKPDKENSKKNKDGTKSDKLKVKKLAGMKETSKLKALKTKARKVPTIAGEGNPKDFANFIQNLFQSSTQNKNKPEDSAWSMPSTSKEPSTSERLPPEPNILEGKLSAEPDKQKLNIFKKISKVKEEKSDKEREEVVPRESTLDIVIDEVIERPWIGMAGSLTGAGAAGSSDIEEVYISDTMSPPGTPSTPRTPELPPKLDKLGGKKRKKDKSKSKSKKMKLLEPVAKKPKIIEQIDLESMDPPKTPEAPSVLFPFAPHFPPMPGLIPPPIMHPMFPNLPNLPFMKHSLPASTSSLPHPAMPNLPIPPPSFMQPTTAPAVTPPPKEELTMITPEVSITVVEKSVDKEKKVKEGKKEDGVKKAKKKKLKKEKIKKEKGEKKKDKEEKKLKDKEKSKEKKEKKKEREREERPELAVPKITLKLGLDSSRPSTPEQSRKIVIKPVVKKDEVPAAEPKRTGSPELARFSALVTRQPKKSKPETAADAPPVEVKSEFRVKEKKASAPVAMPAKDTVAFYHHESSAASSSKAERGSSSKARQGRGTNPGDDAGNKIWICPACKGQDDGSPMIGCDDCDAWYHWVCVGIQVPPDDKEDWYCRECIQRKQEALTSKKKIKKKNKV